MEPPVKRRKTYVAQADPDEEDELFIEPEEINRRRDPNVQLQQARDRAANKLKSRFESIFSKYERDFEGVGDVIDIMTGEIVEDNGHLRSMEISKVGNDESDEDSSEEDQRGQGKKTMNSKMNSEAIQGPKDPWRRPDLGLSEPRWPQTGVQDPSQLSSLFGNGTPYMTMPSRPFPPLGLEPPPSADPNWQAPALPQSTFLRVRCEQEQAPRRIVRSFLSAPHGRDADEEDVLLDTADTPIRTEESPLIRQKFPAVDSSPNNDNSHNDLIREVIENMPDTPPSIQKTRTARSLGKPSPLGQHHAKPEAARRAQNRKGRGRSENLERLSPTEKANHVESKTETSWEDSDLESFLDVTGARIKELAGQRLFVDIRKAKKNERGESRPVNRGPIKEVTGKAVGVCERTSAESLARNREAIYEETSMSRQKQAALEHRRGKQTEDSGRTPQEEFARNIMDPDFMFSDEETLLPRRRVRPRAGPAGSTVAAVSMDTQITLHVQSESPAGQEGEVKPSQLKVRAPRRRASIKLGGSGSVAGGTIPEQPGPEPVGTNAPQAAKQPSTPQAKPRRGTGIPATTASLISLLSDAEDEEDEISFDLSEFTPSGHHRILVHRPLFPRLSTHFSSSASSNKKKKMKRASLHLAPPSTKSHKFHTPAKATPGPTRCVTTGDHTRKRTKREGGRRTKQLAQSVIRVFGGGGEATSGGTGMPESPAGSVVQTPGGTRRRCGEDGWSCERDFCFVCM